MTQPDLTIGMATFEDFYGVYFTVQSLRLHHPRAMSRSEIVVVDNRPSGRHGDMTADLIERKLPENCRYVPMASPIGTSAPRQRVFDEARGQAVLCMDSHILLPGGVLDRLIAYYDDHPETNDLLSGPMIHDTLVSASTHFDDEWGEDGMWGKWGTAWRCGCSRDGTRFSPNQSDDGRLIYRALAPGFSALESCRACGRPFPNLGFHGHERELLSRGYHCLGSDPDEPAWEVPAQGLGLFSCRRDAWLGFNPHFRGFGGEEFYIHTKFRQSGGRCLCLPWLRWLHRFGRPDGSQYPASLWNKIRNYVIGHLELGLPVERVKKQFVDTGLMPAHEWESLIEDPYRLTPKRQNKSGCGSCGNKHRDESLEDLYRRAAETKSDINEHAPQLRELASQVDHVTEFGMRHGVSTVALLAGQPRALLTYALQIDPVADILEEKSGETDFQFLEGDSLSAQIEPTDLLFIDTKHTADHLTRELRRHADRVRRWIVLHDTQTFGERGEDGGPGLLPALRRFMKENPEWSVIYHAKHNHGLTVLSRDPRDKPKLPGRIEMAGNFAKALSKHVASGAKKANTDVYQKRLEICTLCEHRAGEQCSVCGCPIASKAEWATQQCPLGKWPE